MKTLFRQILASYFNSWWLPAVICLLSLALFCLVELAPAHGTPVGTLHSLTIISIILFGCLGVSFFGILIVAIWNFSKKCWAKGLSNLVMIPVCGGATLFSFGFLLFASMLGPSEDHFADDLTIPANLTVAEPKEELEAQLGAVEDTFQRMLLNALKKPGGNDVSVTASVTALARLQQEKPLILRRYLATSPAWRVFKEHGAVFATRRWMVGPDWRYTLHGYYTRHDLDMWAKSNIPEFQSRFTFGFSGKPWARSNSDTTRAKAGDTVEMVLGQGNKMHESRLVVTADGLVVEIFEQSGARERRLTKATLNHLNEELGPLVESPKWETIKKCVPSGSIGRGKASLDLRKSFQPGLYDSIIWVNAGEAGMIYLKAFEVTKGTALSVDSLQEYSNEWIGWSDNPTELFFSNTHFTIHEGDWGKPYAARFEIWFVPDAGGPERKLIEKVFKIEGWQR